MARPRSDDKRKAILLAATTLFAERGLAGTPTAAISRAAGVAEGTLFTYFPTKGDLINELYRDIKLELAALLLPGLSERPDIQGKLRHVWDRHIAWGIANPLKVKALAQLSVSDKITEASIAFGREAFREIEFLAQENIARQLIRDCPVEYVAAIWNALAETTMAFMTADPARAEAYRESGFDMFWQGVSLG